MFKQLESSLNSVCSVLEHDKLLLHVLEVEKICFLLVILSCRLVNIEYGLSSMDWSGREEREYLERRREKGAGGADGGWKTVERQT